MRLPRRRWAVCHGDVVLALFWTEGGAMSAKVRLEHIMHANAVPTLPWGLRVGKVENLCLLSVLPAAARRESASSARTAPPRPPRRTSCATAAARTLLGISCTAMTTAM